MRRALLFLALLLALAGCGGSAGAPSDRPAESTVPMGHIHGLGIDPADGTLYIATHTGLFHVTDESVDRVADRFQDTMAFTVVGPGHFLGSGHPDLREDLPPHLGLIESTDAGETWQSLALQGEADFHALETAGDVLYGYDATSGRLLATEDRKTFRTVGELPLLSLAAAPDRLLGTTNRGEVVSIDGETGTTRRVADHVAVLVDASADGTLVSIGPGGDVHVSTGTSSWQRVGTIGDTPAALTVGEATWYAATAATVLASTDGGATWTEIHPRRG